MYPKLFRFATFLLGVLCAASCSVSAPWRNEPVGQEVNLAFIIHDNLPYLQSAMIDGHTGRFLFGSAQQTTVLDTKFARAAGENSMHALHLNERQSLQFPALVADLHGVADAIIGASVWGDHAVTIDYRAGLLTFQREGIHPDLMTIYHYSDQPTISISVDGKSIPAILDTTSPDSLVVPGGTGQRRGAHIQIAGTD